MSPIIVIDPDATPPTTTTTAAPTTTTPKPGTPKAITADTPFRQIPDLSRDQVCAILKGYPMAEECPTLTTSALALAQSYKESQYGKTAQDHNPLGLMMADGHTLMTFSSWRQAFAEWQRRMDDPAYKGGVYMPLNMSLKQFIYIYVGGPGCWSSGGATCANNETKQSVELYLQQTIDRLNRYFGVEAAPDPTPAPTGHVPKPNIQVRLIENNTAWDDLGPRIPRGIVLHRMLGTLNGTDAYFRGEARGTALTDFGIGAGTYGRIYQWNGLTGQRAPWASGPADGIKGDGRAFVDRYGVNAINRDCASIEIEGQQTTPIPAADWGALVDLVSWLADDWLGVTWQQWPKNRDGLHALLHHREFTGQKECPFPVVIGQTAELIDAVHDRLKQYQGASS